MTGLFHIEYRVKRISIRFGTYDDEAEAIGHLIQVNGREESFEGGLVYRGGGTSQGSGDLVSAVDIDNHVIEAQSAVKPRWWDNLSETRRQELLDLVGYDVPTDLSNAVIAAGGFTAITSFGQHTGKPQLGDQDRDWIRLRSVAAVVCSDPDH
jgi:hypothetical protein